MAEQVAENKKSAKIVRTDQFAYNRATTRNGDKISIAYRDGPDCVVSSAYGVFEITKKEKLLPEYIEFILDKDFDCFIYVCYNQYYDVSNIAFAFTEDYKQPFMNVVNSIIPDMTYSYKTILRCMDIDEDLFVKKYGDNCFKDGSYYFEASKDSFNDFKNKI